jgi:hypothetical protein
LRQYADPLLIAAQVLRHDGAVGLALLSGAAVAALAVGAAVLKRR